jgi:hypothetical protein
MFYRLKIACADQTMQKETLKEHIPRPTVSVFLFLFTFFLFSLSSLHILLASSACLAPQACMPRDTRTHQHAAGRLPLLRPRSNPIAVKRHKQAEPESNEGPIPAGTV